MIAQWMVSDNSLFRGFGLAAITFLAGYPKDKNGHAIMLEVLNDIESHKYPEMWNNLGIQETFRYDTKKEVYDALKKWKAGTK